MKANPSALIVTTCRWLSAARLAVALSRSGFRVHALCPPRHLIGQAGVVDRLISYQWMRPLSSLAEAIAATNPELVIPCDDRSTQHLHDLYAREQSRGEAGASTCALIERSLGSPQSFSTVYARTRCMKLAQEESILVPETEVIPNLDALADWSNRVGFPMVLKADGTSGGEGVRVVNSMVEAERAFRKLNAPPAVAKAAKWALIDRDMTLVLPTVFRTKSIVNAQRFVAGPEATTLVACWKGEVLASLHFKVLQKQRLAGPATVLRLIDNREMEMAAQKMVRRLDLSGFHGFDFMLEDSSGAAYLIEINPRTTQVGHLTLGPKRDLPAALRAALTGEHISLNPKLTEKVTIALFPGEWRRNPDSTYLQSGYHDVPWDSPGLVPGSLREDVKQKV